MPERVTKEERLISMVIEKAREVKQILHLSLNDNNRSPIDDDSEVVKLKRPKAENAKDLVPKNRKGDGYGLGGQMTHFKKAVVLMKAILKEEMDNPFLNEERKREAIANLEATEKELDDLQEMFRSGDMNQVRFQKQFGAMLRRLTEMQQMLGGQPDKDPAVPLLPAQNKYR